MPRILTNLWFDTEAVSLLIDCADQDEVDPCWSALSTDGADTAASPAP
jgi:predicted 3-demethylubiquinone-9 3-methyltransferase (glyoxalase superfamily)